METIRDTDHQIFVCNVIFVFSFFFYIQKLFQKFCDEKKMSLYIRIKVKFTFKFNLYFIICMDIVVKLFV